MKLSKNIWLLSLLGLLTFQSCDDDDVPFVDNQVEFIDQVILTFTPAGASNVVTVNSVDPDGEGPASFSLPTIDLVASEVYTLTIELNDTVGGQSVTDLVEENDNEYMFFFEFTSGLFASPVGNGNIGRDSRNDPINYVASENDENGNPLGITTIWETADAQAGTLKILLQHQPDTKSDTSDSTEGISNVNLTWPVVIN